MSPVMTFQYEAKWDCYNLLIHSWGYVYERVYSHRKQCRIPVVVEVWTVDASAIYLGQANSVR